MSNHQETGEGAAGATGAQGTLVRLKNTKRQYTYTFRRVSQTAMATHRVSTFHTRVRVSNVDETHRIRYCNINIINIVRRLGSPMPPHLPGHRRTQRGKAQARRLKQGVDNHLGDGGGPGSITNDLAITQLLSSLSAWSHEMPPASLSRVGQVLPLQLQGGEHSPIFRLLRLDHVDIRMHACSSGECHRLL